MDDTAIATIRSFNRLAVERIGALDGDFLGRKRPVGEARLLWEIGRDGADLRDLRARLGLDSGYLSRLLRALADDGLVTVARGRRRRTRPAGDADGRRAGASGRSWTGARTPSPPRCWSRWASASAASWWRRWRPSSAT